MSEFVLERWEAIYFCFYVLSCSYESTASDSRKQKWSQQATSNNTSISVQRKQSTTSALRIVHPKMKILSSFIHSHVVPILWKTKAVISE